MDDLKYWLWLVMAFGVGNRRVWEIASLCGSAKEAYFAVTTDPASAELTDDEKKAVAGTDLRAVSEHIAQCEKLGIKLVGYDGEEYPAGLRHIYNPPAVLYYKGDISCLKGARSAVAVGTRRASDYGLDAAFRICGELARSGVVIVSGFALGTDITAHMAAAKAGRPTVCVMGCGVDVDYPKDNFRYRDAVLGAGGVFISEYPPGTPPRPQNFPQRNRILAGLGYVALVFEASLKSGSLITARLAAAQGRDVFCLPPADIFSGAFSGNIELLREGAEPLFGASDVLDRFRIGGALDAEIRSERYSGVSGFGYEARKLADGGDLLGDIKKAGAKSRPKRTKSAEKPSPAKRKETGDGADKKITIETENTFDREELSELGAAIAEAVASGTKHADEIAAKLGFDATAVLTELTELEMLGVVKALPGKMFEINE